MTTETLDPPTATTDPRIIGMRCRNCGHAEPIGLSYVCPACFGPLEVAYDYALIGRTLTREAVERRGPGIWRFAELLPVDRPPARGLAVGSTPLTLADRLAPTLGVDRLWIKDDTRNPSLSFKDRAVAVAAARAVEFGVEALCCASTGNLAGATAAAAAAIGLPAYVFIPADLEPAKVDHALAYGATVVPIDGTYDDVNRLCLEVADETGWGFVNINLRPFYAEGSKTLAYEIAESLGWRSPDVIVAPVASGAMFTRVARGFEELADLGLIERRADPLRGRSGRRAAPRSRPRSRPAPTSSSRSASPTPSSARSPSATRPTAGTPSNWRATPAVPSRRSRTPTPPPRSATSRGSRGSTRRRPAGSRSARSPPPADAASSGMAMRSSRC